jgi:hypothetical protein
MIFYNLPQNIKNFSGDPSKFTYALKIFFLLAPIILGGNILTGEQGMIWVLINYLYIGFYLLYMVTNYDVNSIGSVCTTDVSWCDESYINVSDLWV